MAGILKRLAKQPKPLLQRVDLDKQPKQTLIQKLFGNRSGRRPGQRQAITGSPLGFLEKQPARPLLSGITLWKKPLISMNTWLSKPPLAAASKPGKPALDKMDGTRMPGVVTALILLALSVGYLVTQLDLSPQPPVLTADAEEAVAEAPEAETLAVVEPDELESVSTEPEKVAATPVDKPKEKMVAEAAAKPAQSSKPAPAPQPEAQAAAVEAKKPEPATQPVVEKAQPASSKETGKDEPAQFSLAPLTPEEEAEIEAAIAQARGEPVKPVSKDSNKEAVETAKAANLMADPAAKTKKKESKAVAKPQTVTPEPEPVAVAKAQPATAPKNKPAEKPAPSTRRPVEPASLPTLSEERSQAIIDSALYIYQLGDGTMALERLGLAISAGHVHPDYVEKFSQTDAAIRNLLTLFDQAIGAPEPNQAALKRAAFLDAERSILGQQSSAYATRLEMAANLEISE